MNATLTIGGRGASRKREGFGIWNLETVWNSQSAMLNTT